VSDGTCRLLITRPLQGSKRTLRDVDELVHLIGQVKAWDKLVYIMHHYYNIVNSHSKALEFLTFRCAGRYNAANEAFTSIFP